MSCKYYYMLQDKKTPLHWASEGGHSEVITVLIAHGGNVEAQDKVNEIRFMTSDILVLIYIML